MFKYLVFSLTVGLAFCAPKSKSHLPLPDGRIVGGHSVFIEDVPYMSSLQYLGSHICGAAIITDKYVLTAAHCTDGSEDAALSIRAGTSYKERDGVVVNVAVVHQNPAFDSSTIDYDISVLELQIPLVFTLEIQPIKLPMVNQEVPAGLPAFVTGWGVVTEGGFEPTVLQGVDIEIVSREACMEAYGNDITNQMICAGVPEGGKDSCSGDSGGPLVVGEEVVGLVSWGNGCARPGYPGVYSSVPGLRGFIYQIIGM